MFIQQYLYWERAMLIRIIQRLLAELRPHRKHHHHHHHRRPAAAGFVFFTEKDNHMAIITNLAIGASGVAHAAFVDANGNAAVLVGSPVWSASNADATVTPRSDGLTADVTRLTANAYAVTCAVDGVTASADLPLPSAGQGGAAVSGSIGFTDV